MKAEHQELVDIAVVGASVLYPGSTSSESFWSNILVGADFMTETPKDHWLIEDYHDLDQAKPGKTYANRGAFLPKVDFDPMKYGMPPNKISSADTAQLLALIVAEKVLEDANSVQFKKVDRKEISVILGMAAATELMGQVVSSIQRPIWVKALRESGIPESQVQNACDRIEKSYPEWDEATFPGLLGNVVAGRIANRMDLGGTNCVIDAACASSSGAVSMAIQELRLGQADLVITGGVDALNDIFMFMCFSKTPALSKTGDCRPFSDDADGTMLGEGLGMVALRRLKDAERDGDKIYAVIKGMGTSSDGLAKSIYAPRSEGQELAVRRAYHNTGYLPEDVELIEAHGTATNAGDIAEFRGLQLAFSDANRQDKQYCALGSVKSQIGHTKAAAGAASLFKIVMALHHKVLPPTIKVNRPNPKFDITNSPFYLNTKARPWIHETRSTRKASVSAFGFGGSNFHMTCEEYIQEEPAYRFHQSPKELILFHGENHADLEMQIKDLLENGKTQPLANLARKSQENYTFTARMRLAVLAADLNEMKRHTESAMIRIQANMDTPFSLPNAVHYGTLGHEPKVAFLFPGQGSQYVDMGADLAMHFDAARRVWDQAASRPFKNTEPLHRVVFPIPVFDDQERLQQDAQLKETQWAQPALGCVSSSMLALLDQLGLKPDAAAGHSYGEITALHASGSLGGFGDMLQVSRKRGMLMSKAAEGNAEGTMTAVFAGRQQIQEMLDSWKSKVTIANINSPKQVVLAGKVKDVASCESKLKESGVRFTRLPVATAFHSSIVSSSAEPFLRFLEDIPFDAPEIPVYANTTGKPYPAKPGKIRQLLGNQLAKPVLWEQLIQNMYDDGFRVFLEVGPGSTLSGMVKNILKEGTYTAIPMDSRKTDGRIGLWNALGALAALGCPMDFKSLWSEFAVSSALVPEKKPSPVTVQLNGANYGKPYPPKNGADGMPKPNPEHPPLQKTSKPMTQQNPNSIENAHAPDPKWLDAFQTMQKQMHDAQIAFQNTMSESHHAFLKASESAFQQLGQQSGMASSGPLPSLEAVVQAVPVLTSVDQSIPLAVPQQQPVKVQVDQDSNIEAVLLSVVSDKTGYPVEMLDLEMDMESSLGIDSIKRVEIISALQEALPAIASADMNQMSSLNTLGQIFSFLSENTELSTQESPDPVSENQVDTQDEDQSAILLEVVAEKTGYPAEMLKWDMALESELGIDSIKRVEILSAIQDRIPQLASVDMAKMTALNTLAEIRDFMGPSSSPSASSGPIPQSEALDYRKVLKEVVAEKTGYPVEMLDLSMELESGLGIDSIKRVEILSALQEAMPALAKVDMSQMSTLNTLGEINDFVANQVDAVISVGNETHQPKKDIEKIIYQVVADKTGYPVEMLNLDMELESGLGIDSIKRVEILSALQDALPSCAGMDMGELGILNTLGEIHTFISSGNSNQVDSELSSSISLGFEEQRKPQASLVRSVLKCVPSPPTGIAMTGIFESKIYILSDAGDIASHLGNYLEAVGIDVEVVQQLPQDARSVISLSSLNPIGSIEESIASNRHLFQQIQSCATSMFNNGIMFITVQATGGRFSTDGHSAWHCGTAALAKTARQEWPIPVKAIDIETHGLDSETIAKRLRTEILSGGSEMEVGLTADGGRHTLKLFEDIEATEAVPYVEGDTLVVSGGARGVTAACTIELAKNTPLSFAILGRTTLNDEPESLKSLDSDSALKKALLEQAKNAGEKVTPQQLNRNVQRILASREVRSTLEAIKETGSKVQYYPVDVCDPVAVEETIARVRTEYGQIHGLIHAAGVIADKHIHEKTEAQFDRVFNTKVLGLKNLLKATEKDVLKQITVFSSVAARTGNTGQVDYAMANEVLNRVCQAEHANRGEQCRVKSIGWGPWEGGMVRPELAAAFVKRGISLIPLKEGAAYFVEEIQGTHSGCEIVYGGSLDQANLAAENKRSNSHEWKIWLHEDSFPYLRSHTISGTPVVPVVLISDICLGLAKGLYPEQKTMSVNDLKVLHGIKCEGFSENGDWLTISCASEMETGELTFNVTDSNQVPCYSLMSKAGASSANITCSMDQDELGTWVETPDTIYNQLLFHGEDFQVIQSTTGISKKACEAQLLAKQGVKSGISPRIAILDGGLQLALLWERNRSNQESLPTRYKSLRVFEEIVAGEEVRVVLESTHQNQLLAEWNVFYYDAAGTLIAEIEGLGIHVLLNGRTKMASIPAAASAK